MPNANASAQLRLVSVRLKEQGAGALKLELTRALKAAAKPLIPDVQTAARDQLPRGGGLNERVANQKVTVSVRTGATNAGVRLTTKDHDTKATNAGYVRHPVFGHMDRWKTQQIPDAAGWWSGTLAAKGPEVTPAIIAVLDEVTAAIQRGF
jgi:hypothetical protein